MEATEKSLKKYYGHLKLGLVASCTLGLAPFMPQPHVWQKLKMLYWGSLYKPIDIFDLLMHGAPWLFVLFVLVQIGRFKLSAQFHPGTTINGEEMPKQ